MGRKETALTNKILLEYADWPNIRLFRSPTSMVWVGKFIKVDKAGFVMLAPGARRMFAGLVKGASDIIGIGPGGKFVAIEVKATGSATESQSKFIDVIQELGGIAGVATCVEDVAVILRKAES